MFDARARRAAATRRGGLRRPALELRARPARESERIAAGLAALGVGAGDRVVMLLSNRARVRVRAARRAAARRDRRAGRRARAAARRWPTSRDQCGAKAIVFDDELAERVPERRRGAGAAGCACRRRRARRASTADAARRRPLVATARDRRRRDPLHLGDDRPSQGRDAHPPRDRPLGAALRSLHAPRGRRPLGAGGAGEPRHRPRSPTSPAMWRVGGTVDRRARVQGRRVHRAARARARHPHADGAGDVPPLPAERRASRAPTCRRGASAATAARRCRWRRSTRSPRACPA